jgi:cytochrome c-type biogenesis protein CcmE
MRITFKSKQTKFIIAGFVVFIIVGYMVYAGIRDTKVLYMTPSEISASGLSAYDRGLRLGGIVLDGSIEYDTKTLILAFSVTDGETHMPVVYRGVVPDAFQNGVEIVVEGRYTRDGVFKATALFPKCPSKYEPVS